MSNDNFQLYVNDPKMNPVGILCEKFHGVMGDDKVTLHDKIEITMALQAADVGDHAEARLSNDGKELILTIPQVPKMPAEEECVPCNSGKLYA
jgi:hypothetical protein